MKTTNIEELITIEKRGAPWSSIARLLREHLEEHARYEKVRAAVLRFVENNDVLVERLAKDEKVGGGILYVEDGVAKYRDDEGRVHPPPLSPAAVEPMAYLDGQWAAGGEHWIRVGDVALDSMTKDKGEAESKIARLNAAIDARVAKAVKKATKKAEAALQGTTLKASAFEARLDAMKASRSIVVSQRDALLAECDALRNQVKAHEEKHARLCDLERDALIAERDALKGAIEATINRLHERALDAQKLFDNGSTERAYFRVIDWLGETLRIPAKDGGK